jgi:hypothetical protein
MRWTEEVELLQEEMRRVLEFLGWQSNWWRREAVRWEGLPVDQLEGYKAYGIHQAECRQALCIHFQFLWRDVDKLVKQGHVEDEESPENDND